MSRFSWLSYICWGYSEDMLELKPNSHRTFSGLTSPCHHSHVFIAESHRSVLHELHLQSGNLRPECTDLLAGLVLVHHHLVLDVASSVSVLQCVQGFHEVLIWWADAGDHHCSTKKPERISRFIYLLILSNATMPNKYFVWMWIKSAASQYIVENASLMLIL